jgi:competence protein ComEA
MLQWFKEIYAEFTPRALKVTITALAVVGFAVYVLATSTSVSAPVVVSKFSSSKPTVSTAKIFVHIAGKVRKPGIYQLDSGARVYDLVLLAGGFSAKANQASVNLARVLTDGEQVIITDGNSAVQGLQSNLISLNQASASTLEDLPGVGPALASRIVDWREANGGFKTKEDLLNVAGIGDKLFASVKELVTL